jgi:hypothetical protein
MKGNADLAHQHQIQRRMQRLRNGGGDGRAAARQGEHDRAGVFVAEQRAGEATARLGSIKERHGYLP